jgi:hypothetical protein
MLEDCPHLPSHFANNIEQLNVVFQRQRNDPYGPTFNQGWKNHPNFSWAQGNYQGGPVPTQASSLQFPRPNTGPYPNQNAFVNPQQFNSSPQNFPAPANPPPGFANDQKLSTLERNLASLVQTVQTMSQTANTTQ